MRTEFDLEQMRVRINRLKQQIKQAAEECGRDPDEITLVGVSKYFPAEYAAGAFQSGITDLGENRVQEMLAKIDRLDELGLHPRWHLIGTLQKNKVKYVISKTSLIHSVDQKPLLMEISKRSGQAGLKTDVLLQVNISGEDSKHGFTAGSVVDGFAEMVKLPAVRIKGLMTMAPLTENPEITLSVFRGLKKLRDQLTETTGYELPVLSMGMSQDFCQAIACGATHIRIGTAIFGVRPQI